MIAIVTVSLDCWRINMKVLLTTPLRNFDGRIMVDGPRDVIVRNVLLQVFSMPLPNDNLNQDESAKRYALGVKIASCSESEIDLTTEEIVLLKSLVAKIHIPLVYGQIAKILENQPTGIQPFVEPIKVE